MSSFEDIETQNARRSLARDDRSDWHWLTMASARHLIALGRDVSAAYNAHVALVVSMPTMRRPRTALGFGLLPPVGP